jgi:hypothetical protein
MLICFCVSMLLYIKLESNKEELRLKSDLVSLFLLVQSLQRIELKIGDLYVN